jgi:CubicO group peptidase (beta-lactamase class C family)
MRPAAPDVRDRGRIVCVGWEKDTSMERSHEVVGGRPSVGRLSRRTTLRGFAGALAATPPWSRAGSRIAAARDAATPTAATGAPVALSAEDIGAFEDAVKAAMRTFKINGAAVALVQGMRVAACRGFGVRNLRDNAPATEHTRFRIGSNTKSMTSLLLATFVDRGALGWDDRVIDRWPEFRAPTAELTQQLRIPDLLGMASGIAETPTVRFAVTAGSVSALDLLRSVAYLPVAAPPNTKYLYNNTLYSAAGFLAPIAQGTPSEALDEAYATLMRQRVFAPLGMADAAIADDPRPLGDNYAVGYTRDLFGRQSAAPFVTIAGAAPSGSGVASAADMARYLQMQIAGGVTPEGVRVVSAANLAETHQPGIAVPPNAIYALPVGQLPDTVSLRACQGWFEQIFTDGRRLFWFAGGIDGFTSLMGFFPADGLGFAILSNQDPGRGGASFVLSAMSSLLSRLFGLYRDLPAAVARAEPEIEARSAQLAVPTRPVDPTAVAPWLGFYGSGFRLRLDDAGVLRLDHDVRSMPLLALPNGDYVVADGPGTLLEQTVSFTTNPSGSRSMRIDGLDPVRWLTGG